VRDGAVASPRFTVLMRSSDGTPVLTLRRVETDFCRLAVQWRRAVDLVPTVDQMVAHPTYDAIINLGPPVVPYLLGELVDRPDHWFRALERLTAANPAEASQTYRAAADAWLRWAREHGFGSWVPARA
jgi:hypothetical protein